MKGYHRHVSKNTGKNPVAQAVARDALSKAVVDQKIALYMLTPGEQCAELLAGLAGTMQITLNACLIDRIDTVDVRILKGGLNACIQVMLTDSYDTMQTQAIATGLDKALTLVKKVKPDSINKAWAQMVRGIQE